jgi:C-terminal processing protease CtpA/Prc
MRLTAGILFSTVSVGVLSAQLLQEQRVQDFQNLTALYEKRYAPYSWKLQAFGYDLFNTKPWLDRIRAAKDDLEFFEIEAEYVANLQDTHSYLYMTSSFSANLGITVDIYDGKVLIDSINRALLPQSKYPFAVGDELVSVDGKSVEDWITLLSTWRRWGNPATTRRNAAGEITVRSQSTYPRAVEVGNTSSVAIRRADGTLENYTMPWAKSGVPVFKVGPVPMPHVVSSPQRPQDVDDPVRALDELHSWKVPDYDPILQTIDWATDPDGVPRKFVNGVGSRTPIFRTGLPASFNQRLGRVSADFHFSGTYTANGKTIGLIRIPSFSPGSQAAAIKELETEITYMQQNTDGLVIDVMRNPGGGCYMYDAAAHLIPYPFYFFGELVRATQDRYNSYQATADLYRALGYDSWIVNAWQSFADAHRDAMAQGRGLTWPVPACAAYNSTWPPTTEANVPASIVYYKPLIVLVDEFSISAADIFPSMMQDNLRGPLVGMRTSGGGGSISGWPAGLYSESNATNTNTLVVRKGYISTPDLPTASYVENIGARPDITLDYMTRDNLLSGGKAFVDQFTQIILDRIAKGN